MFEDKELLIIWFALMEEQQKHEEGGHRWHRYEIIMRKIEEYVGSEMPRVH